VYDDVVGCLLDHEATKRERKKVDEYYFIRGYQHFKKII
jgi:hypothetical protein